MSSYMNFISIKISKGSLNFCHLSSLGAKYMTIGIFSQVDISQNEHFHKVSPKLF